MVEDKRAEPPEPKPTVELPALTDRALLEDLARTSRETKAAVARVEANQELSDGQIRVMQVDIHGLFEWKGTIEERLHNNSTRAKSASEVDLSQEAKLTDVILWRKSVDEKLANTATKEDLATVTTTQTAALVAKVDELAKNPTVARIVAFIIGAIGAYAASKGLHL